jgi:hypothetical protein
MAATRLAVFGVSRLELAVPVVAALTMYFGERPLAISLQDDLKEVVDLMERFCRAAFFFNQTPHELILSGEVNPKDLTDFDRLILLKSPPPTLWPLHPRAQTLDLTEDRVAYPVETYRIEGWPVPRASEHPTELPLQILRWVRGEEYMIQEMKAMEHSPLGRWLDDVSAAQRIPAS